MPAVTVVSRARAHVVGNRRALSATVTVGASGDTYTVSGFKKFDVVVTNPATALTHGVTHTGNVITFLSAASNPTQVFAVGI